MRWLLSVVVLCVSLTLMGQSCGDSAGGGGGSGAAGEPGTGGDAGMDGAAGTRGVGGSLAGNDCGYSASCEPYGMNTVCQPLCDELCDGGQDEVYADACLDDARCWCWCATGVCSEDDCIETPTCRFDDPDESFCEEACAQVCDGADDIREAFCDGTGDVTGYCECRCKVGGSVSCSGNF